MFRVLSDFACSAAMANWTARDSLGDAATRGSMFVPVTSAVAMDGEQSLSPRSLMEVSFVSFFCLFWFVLFCFVLVVVLVVSFG